MSERDRMTTSSDRTLPVGMTEAEAVAQEQRGFSGQQKQQAEQAAVSREEAEKRLKAAQEKTKADEMQHRKPVERAVVEEVEHQTKHAAPQPALDEIEKHLDAIAVLCLKMKNGPELSAFYMHLGNCQRQVEMLTVGSEDVVDMA